MYVLIKNLPFDITAVKFGVVGIANTAVGLSVIYALKWLAGVGDVLANVLGYSVGLLMSFALNAKWSFCYRGSLQPALFRFIAVFLVGYLMNLVTVIAAIDNLGIDSYAAQAMGIIPYVLFTYLASKFYVFQRPS